MPIQEIPMGLPSRCYLKTSKACIDSLDGAFLNGSLITDKPPFLRSINPRT